MSKKSISSADIARLTGVKEPIVRGWQKCFPVGENDKLDDPVDRTLFVRMLREDGLSMPEIQQVLDTEPEVRDWFFKVAERKWDREQLRAKYRRYKRDKAPQAYEPPPISLISSLPFPQSPSNKTSEIMLPSDDVLLVDEDDAAAITEYSWYVFRRSGVQTVPIVSENAPTRYLTQFLLQRHFSKHVPDELIKSFMVLHLNHDDFDYRKASLHVCNQQASMWHRRPKRTSASKYKGVRSQRKGRWSAKVSMNGNHCHLGTFDTEEEAAEAYNVVAYEMFGNFAYLNDITSS